jgi:Lrp/AsnC family leucine-responsive transcriptional regulator
MDQIDMNILSLLEENGRMPVKEISDRVNLTSPAVSERIKRLEKLGVINGYQAILNHNELGFLIRAIVNITMKVEKYPAFYELSRKDPAIVECYHVTGSYCMTVMVAVKGVQELEKLLNQIQKFGDTNTQIILSSPFDRKGYINH